MVDKLGTELWCTTVSVTGVVICACDAFNGPLCSQGLLAILGNARTRSRARTAFFQHVCSITPRAERRPALWTVQWSPSARTDTDKHRRVVTSRRLVGRWWSSSGRNLPAGGAGLGVQARRQRIGLSLETVTAAASISTGKAAPRAAKRWTTPHWPTGTALR